MPTINELIDLYREIEDRLIEQQGEVDDVLEDELMTIAGSISDKLDACQGYIKYAEGQAEWLKSEAKDLTARAKTMENSVDSLRKRMAYLMQVTGNDTIRGRHSYSLRTTESWKISPAATTELMEQLYSEGLAKREIKPDIAAIKKAYAVAPAYIDVTENVSICIR